MLSDLIENGQVQRIHPYNLELAKTWCHDVVQEACYQYWSQNTLAQFGEYTVDVIKEKSENGYFTRKMTLYNVKVG